MNVREKLKSDVLGILSDAGINIGDAEKLLEQPPEETKADLALPCFTLASKTGSHPVQFATELKKKLKARGLVKDIRAAAAYLNFYCDWDKAAQQLLEHILKNPEYGAGAKRKEKLLVEHTSANPDGPIHIGHLRNAVIGDSLARIFSFGGWNVKTDFLVNDSGRQIAIAVMQMRKTGEKKPKGKPDWWVCDMYVKGNREIEKKPALEEEVQELIRDYEKGDRQLIRDYGFIVDSCLKGHKETLKELGIEIDSFVKDSKFFFGRAVQNILEEVRKRVDVGNVDGKRVWVDLKQFGIEREFTLTRSDGTAIYPAKDLAYHADKFRRADYNINVLGTDHKFYAKQLTSTLSLLYPKQTERYHIVFYEHLLLPEGQMSTRKGKFVSVDELLETVFKAARKVVEEKMPGYSDSLKGKVARTVGIGALKYAMLKVSPEKTYSFSIEDILSFDGDTAPYIQYTHARARSILRKAMVKRIERFDAKLLKEEKELRLVKLLSRFPDTVSNAMKDYRPHYICSYIFNLATLFNDFYQTVPVLKAEKEKAARLALVKAVSSVLKKGLWLLGIEAPDRM